MQIGILPCLNNLNDSPIPIEQLINFLVAQENVDITLPSWLINDLQLTEQTSNHVRSLSAEVFYANDNFILIADDDLLLPETLRKKNVCCILKSPKTPNIDRELSGIQTLLEIAHKTDINLSILSIYLRQLLPPFEELFSLVKPTIFDICVICPSTTPPDSLKRLLEKNYFVISYGSDGAPSPLEMHGDTLVSPTNINSHFQQAQMAKCIKILPDSCGFSATVKTLECLLPYKAKVEIHCNSFDQWNPK